MTISLGLSGLGIPECSGANDMVFYLTCNLFKEMDDSPPPPKKKTPFPSEPLTHSPGDDWSSSHWRSAYIYEASKNFETFPTKNLD